MHDEIAGRFHELFRGLERVHGIYNPIGADDGNKIKGVVRTVAEPVTDQLWSSHLSGTQGLGITPITDDAMCKWGAIDIDVYTGLDVAGIEQTIRDKHLPLVICRTKSGGIHAFVFFRKPIAAKAARAVLSEWAIMLGYPKAEIFPKQDALDSTSSFGSWLNMPYFGGDDSTRHGIRDGAKLTMEQFLQLAIERAVDDARAASLPEDDLLWEAPPCLQYVASQRLGENGGRNSALLAFAVYAKRRWPTGWQDRVLEFNRTRFSHPLPVDEVQSTVIRSASKKQYKYPCKKTPLSDGCNKTVCSLRKFGIDDGDDPDVEVSNLRQVGDIYYITVDGKDVRLEDATCLRVQEKFHDAVIAQGRHYPKKIPLDAWRVVVNKLLSNAQVLEIPSEATPQGLMWDLIRDMCVEYAKTDLQQVLNRGVVLDGDKYYFMAKTLMAFLSDEGCRVSRNDVWDVLRQHGTERVTRNICGAERSLWAIPVAEMGRAAQTTDFDNKVPDDGM